MMTTSMGYTEKQAARLLASIDRDVEKIRGQLEGLGERVPDVTAAARFAYLSTAVDEAAGYLRAAVRRGTR